MASYSSTTTTETVRGSDVRQGDVLVTRWGDRQQVWELTDDPVKVERVTDVHGRRAAYLRSLTYGEVVGWRGLPDGLELEREADR